MKEHTHTIEPIGILHSPFTQKFGIPRQPGLIKSAHATIELYAPYNHPDTVRGLDDFSHIWVSFQFHASETKWKPLVRPPRLGGNKKVGVFASRSPFRPNGMGLSLVELIGISFENKKLTLTIECPDILDGTPIYDIKPYIRYADSIPHARSGFADAPPEKKFKILFSNESVTALTSLKKDYGETLEQLIIETLEYDPRPPYKDKEDSSTYGMYLYDLNILWRIFGNEIEVVSIQRLSTNGHKSSKNN